MSRDAAGLAQLWFKKNGQTVEAFKLFEGSSDFLATRAGIGMMGAQIDKARKLLVEGNHSIKTISHMVGYQDPNYFSRLFKKWTGQSPTEYRP